MRLTSLVNVTFLFCFILFFYFGSKQLEDCISFLFIFHLMSTLFTSLSIEGTWGRARSEKMPVTGVASEHWSTSLYLSVMVSFLYPASLYVWPNALSSNRQDPQTIKRNFISVAVASAISSQVLLWHLQRLDPKFVNSIWHYINWKSYDTNWHFLYKCLLQPLLYAIILFSVPIYTEVQSFKQTLVYEFPRNPVSFVIKATSLVAKQAALPSWALIRNLVVAPLTEEFIFRGVILAILLPSWSNTAAIIISSLLFGLMHSHNLLRRLYLTGKVSSQEIVLSLVQCTYTAFFGAYASITYIASGHLITPIALHCFCNFNGLPNFGEIISNKCHLYLTILGFATWFYSLYTTCLEF